MKTGRNDPCHCGSGRKYKKCCLMKDERKVMSEEQKQAGPSMEEAIKHLHGYMKQRVIQHNAVVQVLNNILCCLETLPASKERDFVKADFERRINEMVGEGMGRDAQVTTALFNLMKNYPIVTKPQLHNDKEEPVNAEPEKTQEAEPAVSQASEEVQEAKSNAAVSDALEGDVQDAATEVSDVEDEIDDIVEDEDKGEVI